MGWWLKVKIALAVLFPITIAICACCFHIMQTANLRGKEGRFMWSLYASGYLGFVLLILCPIALCSMIYVLSHIRSLWFKIGIVVASFLFLMFLLSFPLLIV